jgi:hypothetical protein
MSTGTELKEVLTSKRIPKRTKEENRRWKDQQCETAIKRATAIGIGEWSSRKLLSLGRRGRPTSLSRRV